jgi:hypothetical protein
MSELLDRIRGELRTRLDASRAAVEEHTALEAALTALGGPLAERAPAAKARSAGKPRAAKTVAAKPRASAKPRAVAPVKTASKQRAPKRAKPAAARAPRGANRAAVLKVLGERPGVGVTELAAASGVAKPVLYNLLATLTKRGEVVAQALPGGGTGYSLPRVESTSFPEPVSAGGVTVEPSAGAGDGKGPGDES